MKWGPNHQTYGNIVDKLFGWWLWPFNYGDILPWHTSRGEGGGVGGGPGTRLILYVIYITSKINLKGCDVWLELDTGWDFTSAKQDAFFMSKHHLFSVTFPWNKFWSLELGSERRVEQSGASKWNVWGLTGMTIRTLNPEPSTPSQNSQYFAICDYL